MARVLARARQRCGSIADYLTAHGVPSGELTALRSALVIPGEDHDEADEAEADEADVAR
jgi:hypothetical protein